MVDAIEKDLAPFASKAVFPGFCIGAEEGIFERA